ncbi:hypothetical protein ACQKKX_03130 [Neorhizobium sp. NPDC001467]|uniref:hypothetical protein n=1 Tax=Neorhizobium sp. NPDC001467 TaxID=3390595 RepID=UPI003D0688F9
MTKIEMAIDHLMATHKLAVQEPEFMLAHFIGLALEEAKEKLVRRRRSRAALN